MILFKKTTFNSSMSYKTFPRTNSLPSFHAIITIIKTVETSKIFKESNSNSNNLMISI